MTNDNNGCQGPLILTPQSRYNQPGLDALNYRVGLYHDFLATMQARLTTTEIELEGGETLRPLQALTTRDSDDPAIALLDAWAVVADILTFYQERLANEGFLRTATERRSILELARLVGYKLRPGVASSVFLAFTMEDGFTGPVPEDTRVQSLPGPGELPQTFETYEELPARAEWNAMGPRLLQPQIMDLSTHTLYLAGTQVNLNPNDPVLVIDAFTDDNEVAAYFRRVYEIIPEPEADHTRVLLRGELVLDKLEEAKNQQLELEQKRITAPTALSVEGKNHAIPNPPTLSWKQSTSTTGVVNYEVFIEYQGTVIHQKLLENPTPSDGIIEYTPDEILLPDEKYEWYVEATDNLSPTSPARSEVPTFTVNSEAIPADGTTKMSPTPMFYWAAADPPNNFDQSVTYTITVNDDENNFEVFSQTTTELSYPTPQTSPLELGKYYSWKVTALDKNTSEVDIVSSRTFTVDKTLPADGIEISTLTPALSWAAATENSDGSPATYTITIRSDVGSNPSIFEGSSDPTTPTTLVVPADILIPGKTYYWQVAASSDTEPDIHIPLRSFTIINPLTLHTPNRHHTDNVNADQAIPLTWQINWSIANIQGSLTYEIRFGQDPQPPRYGETETLNYNIPQHRLKPDTTYYWQVIATIQIDDTENTVLVTGPVWSFTTDGSARETLHNQFVEHIQNMLTTLLSTNRLGDRTASAAKLQAEVNIEQLRIDGYEDIEGDIGSVTRIANSFETLKVSSRWDFQPFINWVGDISTGLEEALVQTDLRRVLQRTSGRVFFDEDVDLDVIEKIKKKAEALPLFTQGDDLNTFAGSILKDIQDIITDEFSPERLAETNEDEKLVILKSLIGRVSDLEVVVSSLDGEEVSTITALLAELDKAITATSRDTGQVISDVVGSLQIPPSRQPSSSLRLERNIEDIFPEDPGITPEITGQMLTTLKPELEGSLFQAWSETSPSPISPLQGFEALRVKAGLYGSNLSTHKPDYAASSSEEIIYIDYSLDEFVKLDQPKILTLDGDYNKIVPGSWVVVEWIEETEAERTDGEDNKCRSSPCVYQVESVQTVSKPNYGKVTQLTLYDEWIPEFLKKAIDCQGNSPPSNCPNQDDITDKLETLRQITIYAQSESIPLAQEPISEVVTGDEIRLDGLYSGLKAGRWLIVSGERADIPNTEGVRVSEVVMLASVSHRLQQILQDEDQKGNEIFAQLPGDTLHTTLKLANALAYRYKRDTVTIHGNVVKATHGETRTEVLGSGDGSQERQAFTLKQPPLTHLAAPTRAGTESTLEVRVNDIRWHEAENLTDLEPESRGYITETDNESNTSIIFGDGEYGARLPTGVENVKAVYRQGIGQGGNVAAEQISLLSTRPLGVKEVINPLSAAGGADRESRDQARWNVPLALMALDRLVSFQDYEDFTKTFAGISKAKATKLNQGSQQIIHLTIAGLEDALISPDSDLYNGLFQALQKFGTLRMPLQIEMRERVILVIIANVQLHPDYLWESVEPKVRQALLNRFSFAQQELGQNVNLSEVITMMQAIPGVTYVDVDLLGSIAERDIDNEETDLITGIQQKLDDFRNSINNPSAGTKVDQTIEVHLAKRENGKIRPAQLAYLSPEIPDTLLLKEVSE